MSDECERCGISQEDYGNIEFEHYGGQDLCEQCYEEILEEDEVNDESEVEE